MDIVTQVTICPLNCTPSRRRLDNIHQVSSGVYIQYTHTMDMTTRPSESEVSGRQTCSLPVAVSGVSSSNCQWLRPACLHHPVTVIIIRKHYKDTRLLAIASTSQSSVFITCSTSPLSTRSSASLAGVSLSAISDLHNQVLIYCYNYNY